MSATQNENDANANANQPSGEFHSSVKASGPQVVGGHQPGQLVSEADHAPTFHAQTLPAGTAPPSRTFAPDSTAETPVTSAISQSEAGASTTASDTLGGATSADVHTGLGHPGQGQSSAEMHDNSGGRGGLQGTGASGAPSAGDVQEKKMDMSSPVPGASQKTTGKEFTPGTSDMS